MAPFMRLADGAGRAIASGRGFPFSSCGTCDDERAAADVVPAKLAQAVAENTSLKKMLGLKQEFGPALVPARVLLYNQEWDREWLIIDAGEADGIKVGDPVIDEREFLVGEIAEVGAMTSSVAIASGAGMTFGVALVPAGGEALAHGIGARALHLELIPRDTPVRFGDMAVRTEKSNKKIPSIFAGRIISVDDQAGGAFKTATAVLLSHPERIDRVMVVK